MHVTPLVWWVTILVTSAILIFDVVVIGRRPHEPSRREVVTALTVYITARSGNLVWVTGSYLALTAFGGVVTLIIFLSRSRSWHAHEPLTTTTDSA